MAGILDGVDQRTQLVGENRLELLLFKLNSGQLYGINVFKVQEVIRCPKLTNMVNSNPCVVGIANMRGKTIPVIDLSYAMGGPHMNREIYADSFVIIADYNRSVQGFLVNSVERIVNMNWEDILAPPKGSGGTTYMTAVTRVDNSLVEIIDVEKVLSEIAGHATSVSDELINNSKEQQGESEDNKYVLVADDSSVARNQMKRTLEQLNIRCELVKDGAQALEFLKELHSKTGNIYDHLHLVISDVEMPNMDGYTLTTAIRKDNNLKDLYIVLHTSLSGVFNQAMVQKVGADLFIPKFKPDDLAQAVIDGIKITKRKQNVASGY